MKFYENLETVMKHFTENGAFLTVKGGEKTNTMVISWGFIGFIWAKPCFITVVRPQRYTDEIIRTADSFTVSVPFDKLKEELKICGSKSGRDINKSEVVAFKASKNVESPIVSGCDMYYECRLLYGDKIKESGIPKDFIDKFYKNDFHNVYIGEIVEVYAD